MLTLSFGFFYLYLWITRMLTTYMSSFISSAGDQNHVSLSWEKACPTECFHPQNLSFILSYIMLRFIETLHHVSIVVYYTKHLSFTVIRSTMMSMYLSIPGSTPQNGENIDILLSCFAFSRML